PIKRSARSNLGTVPQRDGIPRAGAAHPFIQVTPSMLESARRAASTGKPARYRRKLGCGRKEVIEHQVHDDPCNRHIEPHRECPASYLSMATKLAFQATSQRHRNEWNNYRSQKRVRCKYDEVYRPRDSSPGKSGHPVVVVVGKVGNQEND